METQMKSIDGNSNNDNHNNNFNDENEQEKLILNQFLDEEERLKQEALLLLEKQNAIKSAQNQNSNFNEGNQNKNKDHKKGINKNTANNEIPSMSARNSRQQSEKLKNRFSQALASREQDEEETKKLIGTQLLDERQITEGENKNLQEKDVQQRSSRLNKISTKSKF